MAEWALTLAHLHCVAQVAERAWKWWHPIIILMGPGSGSCSVDTAFLSLFSDTALELLYSLLYWLPCYYLRRSDLALK